VAYRDLLPAGLAGALFLEQHNRVAALGLSGESDSERHGDQQRLHASGR